MIGRRDGPGGRQIACLLLVVAMAGCSRSDSTAPGGSGSVGDLGVPLPSSLGAEAARAFDEDVLRPFLTANRYRSWAVDKGVRDTGPYVRGVYYGTHPAVRVFYSPSIIRWLEGGRDGPPPDGGVIIKEQFDPPAAAYEGRTEQELSDAHDRIGAWTVMVRDAAGSVDGWYWAELARNGGPGDPLSYPSSGFGQACIRCHASAADHMTFASLANVRGYPGEPIRYRVDESWRGLPPEEDPGPAWHGRTTGRIVPSEAALPRPNPVFLGTYPSIPSQDRAEVRPLPPEVLDRVVANLASEGFVTSDQCMSCHAALTGPFGPTMFLRLGELNAYPAPGVDVSPYGEWRWSPMGLAGRDPVFHSQIEGELAQIDARAPAPVADSVKQQVVNLCTRCHGALGHQSWVQTRPDEPDIDLAMFYDTPADGTEAGMYGGLARDGISCVLCHRMAEPEGVEGPDGLGEYLERHTTGQYQLAEPGRIFGPFDSISTHPMRQALGMVPEPSEYIRSSRMCGQCHVIDLPIIDASGTVRPVAAGTLLGVEQATFLEWLNSDFQDELAEPGSDPKTCQDCHMPTGYQSEEDGIAIDTLMQRIAVIQDDTYPTTHGIAPNDSIRVEFREEGYARHELLGLNAFLLTVFDQFGDVLGTNKTNYMTGSDEALPRAVEHVGRIAREQTADVRVRSVERAGAVLVADVEVENLTGHRLPSGVGFRRAFLTVEVRSGDAVVWASGRTNEIGVLVDEDGAPLPTEFFSESADGRPRYQPHFSLENPVRSQDQVQIYQELALDADSAITFSFVRRNHELKDNRLLPRGWRPYFADTVSVAPRLQEATWPWGAAAVDPDYADGRGHDVVRYRIELPPDTPAGSLTIRATLSYQAFSPGFLRARFTEAPDGPATRRLHFILSRLQLDGTLIEGFKLEIDSDSASVPPS